MSDWNRIDPPASAFGWREAAAEIERLKAELAESHKTRLGWAAEVGKMAAQRAELRDEVKRLTDDRDKAWDRIDQLTHFLLLAHDCIRHGFMNGEWATIVQTQKTLLPSGAVMEAKNAEKVFNDIGRDLNIDGRDE